MIEKPTLEATLRTPQGKGGARQLRFKGFIPATCYGVGSDVLSLTVDPRQFERLMRGVYGKNAVLDLQVKDDAGKVVASREVMVKAIQKNPITRNAEHADFLVVDRNKSITIEVPIVLEGRAKGVQEGGRQRQISRSVKLSCLPEKIPAAVTYDVSHLGVNTRVMASELTPPEGTSLSLPHDFAFVQISVPRGKDA
jgi:large subunit ribosomal protein L25